MYSSGAEAKMEANPGLYQKLLAEEHDPKLVETIELGMCRIFLSNIKVKLRKVRLNALTNNMYTSSL